MLNKFGKLSRFIAKPLNTYRNDKNFKLRTLYGRYFEQKSINERKVFYESYHGKSATGNPYALFLELQENRKYDHLIHVWALNDVDSKSAEILRKYPNVIIVQRETPEYVKHLSTSKYLINDTSFPYYFQKIEGQVYINTWHGVPLKMIGADVKGAKISAHGNIQRNLLHVDYLVSPNAFTHKKLLESNRVDGLFQGKIIDAGYPRIDRIFKTNVGELKDILQLDQTKKIILYAPTWREYDMKNPDLTAEGVFHYFEELKEKFNEDYQIILKVHYFIYAHFKAMGFEKYCIPDWVDTNELLSCVDILITDYSSIFFDFLPTKKPILFFTYDLEKYKEERGLYMDTDELPGPICETLDEMINEIKNINDFEKKHGDKYEKMILNFAYNDDGEASKRVIDIIFEGAKNEYVEAGDPEGKEKILIWGGGFGTNGITASLINLLNSIDYTKYDVALIFGSKLNAVTLSNLKKVNENTKILYRVGTLNYRFSDFYQHRVVMNFNIKKNLVQKMIPKSLYERELKRVTGNTHYNIGIDYCGYTSFWSLIFAYNKFDKKSIYLHSDMVADSKKLINGKLKHKKLNSITFNLYDHFDNVVSVSKDSWIANQEKLNTYVPKEKIIFVNNALDYNSVLSHAVDYETYERNNECYFLLNETNGNGKNFVSGLVMPKKENVNFVTVGRLSPEKDQEKLILAFAKVHELFENTKLYIVGDGVLKNHLKSLIVKLNLTEDVFLVGEMRYPFALINLCDCFVLSSNYEGQGLVLLEALVLQKPIISTDISGPNSILKDGFGDLVENTETGLVTGMTRYIVEKPMYKAFDYVSYNKTALEMFYRNICIKKDTEV